MEETKKTRGVDYENMKVEHIPPVFDFERDMPEHIKRHFAIAVGEATVRYFKQPGVQEKFEKWVVEWRKTHPPQTVEGANT